MCEKVYRWLLRFYPRSFRDEYGAAAMQLFQDRLRAESGAFARVRLWLDIIGDLMGSVPREHRRQQSAMIACGATAYASATPAFHTLGSDIPRVAALIHGMALSLAIFVGMSVAISRGGGHRPLTQLAEPAVSSFSRFLPAGPDATFAREGDARPNGVWSRLLWLLGAGGVAHTQPHLSGLSQLPDTPAGRQFRGLIQARGSGDYQTLRRFYGEHFERAISDGFDGSAAIWFALFQGLGPQDISKVEVVDSRSERLVVIVKSRSGAGTRHEIEVAAEAPHRIKRYQNVSLGLQKLFPVPASVLQSYVGTYDFGPPSNLELHVSYKDGQLFTQFPGQAEARMVPQSETKFYEEGRVARWIEFVKDEDGKVTSLIANLSGAEAKGRRRL